MMLTAAEARELAKSSSEEYELTQNILEEIENTARKGGYSTFYYTVDYFTTTQVSQELVRLGYKTRIDDDKSQGYVLHIYW